MPSPCSSAQIAKHNGLPIRSVPDAQAGIIHNLCPVRGSASHRSRRQRMADPASLAGTALGVVSLAVHCLQCSVLNIGTPKT